MAFDATIPLIADNDVYESPGLAAVLSEGTEPRSAENRRARFVGESDDISDVLDEIVNQQPGTPTVGDLGTTNWLLKAEDPFNGSLFEKFKMEVLAKHGMTDLPFCRLCDLYKMRSIGLFLLHLYTHENPPWYREFNNILNSKIEEYYFIVAVMVKEMLTFRARPKTLYRGLNSVEMDASKLIIRLNVFSSTTVDRSVAVNNFGGSKGVLLEIASTSRVISPLFDVGHANRSMGRSKGSKRKSLMTFRTTAIEWAASYQFSSCSLCACMASHLQS